jgi:hypothetical protein
LPDLRIEPTGGGSILYVRNAGPEPLAAFLIELVNYPGSSYSFWQDDVTHAPLAPGAEQRIQVANMTIGAVPEYVKVQAALYADGSSTGMPEKITALIDRPPLRSRNFADAHREAGKSAIRGRSENLDNRGPEAMGRFIAARRQSET